MRETPAKTSGEKTAAVCCGDGEEWSSRLRSARCGRGMGSYPDRGYRSVDLCPLISAVWREMSCGPPRCADSHDSPRRPAVWHIASTELLEPTSTRCSGKFVANSDGLLQGCQGRCQSGQGTCAAASVSASRALPADSPCARAALACRSPRARRRVRPRGVSSPSESFGASCSPAEAHQLLVTGPFVRESHARQATFLVEFERQWRDYLHQVLRPEEDVIGRDLTAGEVEALSDEQKVQMVRRSGRLERAPVLASKVHSPSRPRLARLACCVCARVAWQCGSSRFVRTHWAQPRLSYEIRVGMRCKQSGLDRLEPWRGLLCLSRGVTVGWSHTVNRVQALTRRVTADHAAHAPGCSRRDFVVYAPRLVSTQNRFSLLYLFCHVAKSPSH